MLQEALSVPKARLADAQKRGAAEQQDELVHQNHRGASGLLHPAQPSPADKRLRFKLKRSRRVRVNKLP